MCKYQIVPENNLPVCVGTNQLCTFCVTGNMQTYSELENKDILEEKLRTKLDQERDRISGKN